MQQGINGCVFRFQSPAAKSQPSYSNTAFVIWSACVTASSGTHQHQSRSHRHRHQLLCRGRRLIPSRCGFPAYQQTHTAYTDIRQCNVSRPTCFICKRFKSFCTEFDDWSLQLTEAFFLKRDSTVCPEKKRPKCFL